MGLTRKGKRSYLEARHRVRHGQPSPNWRSGKDQAAEIEIWMNAFQLADFENISPWDALLLSVKRRAMKVAQCEHVINEIVSMHQRKCNPQDELYDQEYAENTNPNVPPAEAREWMAESRNEEQLMTRSAKMSVDAGVADAMVRRMELEGRAITDAMIAALEVLNLSPELRLLALSTMHRRLAGNVDPVALPAGSGGDIIDVNPEDVDDDESPDATPAEAGVEDVEEEQADATRTD